MWSRPWLCGGSVGESRCGFVGGRARGRRLARGGLAGEEEEERRMGRGRESRRGEGQTFSRITSSIGVCEVEVVVEAILKICVVGIEVDNGVGVDIAIGLFASAKTDLRSICNFFLSLAFTFPNNTHNLPRQKYLGILN